MQETEALTALLGADTRPGARERRLAERDWNMRAACRDQPANDDNPFFEPDLGFKTVADDGTVQWHRGREAPAVRRERVQRAKDICSGCPVAARCLIDGFDFEAQVGIIRSGVWGGTDERERDALAKTLRTFREVEEAAAAVKESAA